LGAALYTEHWTGHEPGADTALGPLPTFYQAAKWEVRAALAAVPLAARFSAELERGAVTFWSRDDVDRRDWDRAVAIRNAALADLTEPRDRWREAQFRLREALKEGDVRFYVLNAATGDYSEALPNKWWNTTENWLARFY